MQIEQDNIMPDEGSKNKKIMTIIIVLIGVLIIGIMAIMFVISTMKDEKLSVTVNGTRVKYSEDTFFFTEDDKIYISIKDIAPLVGYSAHNGEYRVNVENDENKCYVESQSETTSFYYNSQTISKVEPGTNNDYENITISEPIIRMNDKLYVISDGFVTAFNSTFRYNKAKNTITIETLPSLVSRYNKAITNYEYSKISEEFYNQKALVYGLIVGIREDGKYGVKTIDGIEIISPRYNKIEYVESAGEFIITNSSNKVGIAYNSGKTKINVSYDEIKIIDSALSLYLVKSNNKYGIINSEENFIVHIEYDQIGIETSNYSTENIKNQYVLCDNIIPVKINEKWRLLDIKGNRLTNDEYDAIGFVNKDTKNRIVNNLLILDDTKTIVVGKLKDNSSNAKEIVYGGVDVKGNTLIPISFEAIYSRTSSGITNYYILNNGKEYDAVKFINAIKLRLGYTQEEIETKEEKTEASSTNTNTITDGNVVSIDTNNTVKTNNIGE